MRHWTTLIATIIFTISIGISQNNSEQLIIKDVNLIDGNGSKTVTTSVAISNGNIVSIGEFDKNAINDQATIIDGNGKYLIPGLIDSHVHIMVAGDEDGQKELLESMLKRGVTTVQDLVGDARDLSFYSKQQKRGVIQSPEIFFAAMFTTSDFMKKDFRMAMFPDGQNGELPFLQAVDEDTDFKTAVARANGTGATVIKLYAGLSKSIMDNLAKEAHKLNMKVWCHPAQFPTTAQEISELDIDVFCHAGMLAYSKNNVPSEYHKWLENYSSNEHYAHIEKGLQIDSVLMNMAKKGTVLDATTIAWRNTENGFNLANMITKRAHELGVKISTGTDVPGFPTLEELYNLVDNVKLSPQEALICSSKNGAKAIGIEKTHGTIEVGKVANMVLLDKNPLLDIRNLEAIHAVILNGKIIQPN